MAITQQFNLDMIPRDIPVIIPVDQYDTGIGRLIIKLYKGSEVYTPSNATVKIQGTKPDKKGFSYDATISGNTVTSDLKDQMTACYGDVRTQVVVTESTGRTGTFVFILRVQKSALQNDVDTSETVLPEYINGAQAAAEQALQSEQSAIQASQDAREWASLSPYINPNNYHWMVFDPDMHEWVDTGISAAGGGGSSSYRVLQDKPTIGNEEVNGNKSLWDYGLEGYLNDVVKYALRKINQTVGWEVNNIFNYLDVEIGKDYDGSVNLNTARIIIPLNNNNYVLSTLNYDYEESDVSIRYCLTDSLTPSEWSFYLLDDSYIDFGYYGYIVLLFSKINISYGDIENLQIMLQLPEDYEINHSTFIPYKKSVKEVIEDLGN